MQTVRPEQYLTPIATHVEIAQRQKLVLQSLRCTTQHLGVDGEHSPNLGSWSGPTHLNRLHRKVSGALTVKCESTVQVSFVQGIDQIGESTIGADFDIEYRREKVDESSNLAIPTFSNAVCTPLLRSGADNLLRKMSVSAANIPSLASNSSSTPSQPPIIGLKSRIALFTCVTLLIVIMTVIVYQGSQRYIESSKIGAAKDMRARSDDDYNSDLDGESTVYSRTEAQSPHLSAQRSSYRGRSQRRSPYPLPSLCVSEDEENSTDEDVEGEGDADWGNVISPLDLGTESRPLTPEQVVGGGKISPAVKGFTMCVQGHEGRHQEQRKKVKRVRFACDEEGVSS